jgi:hypothetical protein
MQQKTVYVDYGILFRQYISLGTRLTALAHLVRTGNFETLVKLYLENQDDECELHLRSALSTQVTESSFRRIKGLNESDLKNIYELLSQKDSVGNELVIHNNVISPNRGEVIFRSSANLKFEDYVRAKLVKAEKGYGQYTKQIVRLLKRRSKYPEAYGCLRRLIRTGRISEKQREDLLVKLKEAGLKFDSVLNIILFP